MNDQLGDDTDCLVIDVAHLLTRQWVMENVDGADEETMDPIAGQTSLEGWS